MTEVLMAYTLPDDFDQRPLAIDGAGTLGRNLADEELLRRVVMPAEQLHAMVAARQAV
jgi:hypothetical protein